MRKSPQPDGISLTLVIDILIPILALFLSLYLFSTDSISELKRLKTLSHGGGTDFALAVINTVLIVILQFSYKIYKRQAMNIGALREILGDLRDVDQVVDWLKTFSTARRSVEDQKDPLLSHIGSHCLDRIVTGFEFEDNRIILDGEFLAYESYKVLWEKINRWQNQKSRGQREHSKRVKDIEVVAVHSSAISVWNDSRGKQFLDLQRDFKGRFTRVLIGDRKFEDQPREYIEVARKMVLCETRLFYITRSEVSGIGDLADFLYLPQFEWVLQWQPFRTGRNVRRTHIIKGSDAVRDIADLWDKLISFLEESGCEPLVIESVDLILKGKAS